ncbi:MAG: peptidylprolyl isomerase [Burkholderiales bacterium]|nr:peptidylprolyl isomerase [Burkholderiales bacterium]
MKIAKDTVVALDFELTDPDGSVLEKSSGPIGYLHGGYSGMFAAVEDELEGLEPGAEIRVRLDPDDAFGEYDDGLKRTEPRAAFPRNVEVGMRFEGTGEDSGETRVYTITAVGEERVEVDGNHPYAGKTLDFHCTVKSVRRATEDEITHGHAHGPGGHHHH